MLTFDKKYAIIICNNKIKGDDVMKYMGSKNRISKHLAPIIQSYIRGDTKYYIEPFVGGANMIDKIIHPNRVGLDIHKELIALLNQANQDTSVFPNHISEDEYLNVRDNKQNYPDWYVGLVGFCSTYSARYFEGYARSFKSDGVTPRDMSNEGINNLKKQAPNLKGIKFYSKSFLDMKIDNIENSVVYCDPPYKGSKEYKNKKFPHDEFYKWCIELSKNNTVLISEYSMPSEFECVWNKEVNSSLTKDTGSKKNVEKLFIVK